MVTTAPVGETTTPPAALLEMYRRMRLIRSFETRVSTLYRATKVPGFVHLSVGQEASAVGACWPLLASDAIVSNHRGHGHCLAKGMDPKHMFAELMGKDVGSCRGRGGSMHIADPRMGVFGANGIVGAGLPIAVGAATASKLRGDGGVAVAFFGDGAVAQGYFHEALNLAAVWHVPIVFLCENNGYSEFSRVEDQHAAQLHERALGYGVPYHRVDGNDVVAVAALMTSVVADVRSGSGPLIVESMTDRWHGHYEGDPQRYRSETDLEISKGRDPLLVAREHLRLAGVTAESMDAIDSETEELIETSVRYAENAREPWTRSLLDFVEAPRSPSASEPVLEENGIFRTMDAVRAAVESELDVDPSVYVAGIDVGAGGNVFGLFRGMSEKYPGRVLDTPICESAVVGSAVGAAMAGMRPVVEIMYMDFIGVCFDQLLNQAAKLSFMTGGGTTIPLVVRTQFGAGRSSGSQHSQSLEALLAHIPGLTVVMPSTPADTYGLLRAAIQDPNPVIFVENRLLYGTKGPRPQVDYVLPLGKARLVRRGEHVTLVSYSRMVHESVAAAEELALEGISVEVLDLRTIVPLDRQAILESLAKTHRLVIAHEAVQDFGVGAELAALAASDGFWQLDAPVVRVGAPATPAPYAPNLEAEWLPNRADIVGAVRRLMAT